ncbi:DegT/DnrJ/EryC1/StrS family aminotransferase [Ferviditalea candida]|uniref:Aminotransferase class I/II-fold pyridoxal phosphate-dependent enzyme n=1 Tax=Ferviditalea candida TaxID=3108399 RepID=A0ABU5ZGK0_9BACL|nr:aminotransferase class I/II-fold pyridoxal phosphate-dependent enzyme [Paenibacillaceae bacterium T2]
MKNIPFLKPNLVKHGTYLKYLEQMEQSGIYSNYGPLNTLFEDRVLQEHFGGEGSVTTVSNATMGLILAISQHRRPKGRYALMPSFTFTATPLAALWCGLEPYFIDIDPKTWCMDENKLHDVLSKLGSRAAVVVPYAAFGTDMDLTVYRDMENRGIPVVVDAAASFGTTGESGQFGKQFTGLVVYSFHATKCFAIGEGGMVYSADREKINKIRQAANFGFETSRESLQQGLNAKLSELGASVALSTLDVFSEKISRRRALHGLYVHLIRETGLLSQGWVLQQENGQIAYQFFSILSPAGVDNLDVVDYLAGKQIQARNYFSPACHQHPLFRSFHRSDMEATEEVASRVLSLPLWEDMTENEIRCVVEELGRYG